MDARLAVYDLGSLDIIQALGGQAAIVPDGIGPAYLQPASQAAPARGGSLFEPDAALLAEQAPDLIILGRRSAGHEQALSAISRTINLATRPDHFLQDVQANTLRLGELLDQGPRAQALVDELQDSLEELHGLSAGQTALTLFTVGNGAQVQAPGARHGMLHEVSGLAPVIGAIAAARAARLYDLVMLRVLGASQRQLVMLQLAEFLVLALILALLALALGSAMAWLVVVQQFEFEWLPDWPRVLAVLGAGLALAGNILVGREVLEAMDEAFVAAPHELLGRRLLSALLAGDRAGGDRRGRQSAAVVVMPLEGPADWPPRARVDLRVDDHPDPVVELARLLDLHESDQLDRAPLASP